MTEVNERGGASRKIGAGKAPIAGLVTTRGLAGRVPLAASTEPGLAVPEALLNFLDPLLGFAAALFGFAAALSGTAAFFVFVANRASV